MICPATIFSSQKPKTNLSSLHNEFNLYSGTGHACTNLNFSVSSKSLNDPEGSAQCKTLEPKSFTIRKNPFSENEDQYLLSLVEMHGPTKWQTISKLMYAAKHFRNGRQCRDRYFHYLDPKLDLQTKWTDEDDELLIKKVDELGKKWKILEKFFKGRTEVQLRNRYNLLTRKVKKEERKKEKARHQSNVTPHRKSKVSNSENKNLSSSTLDEFEPAIRQTNSDISGFQESLNEPMCDGDCFWGDEEIGNEDLLFL